MNARWITRTLAVAAMGALALMLVPAAAEAQQTASATIAVSANVAQTCHIETLGNLAFGAYDPMVVNATADLDATASIRIRCTRGSTGVWVGMDNGLNYAAGRQMISGADLLHYELYLDATRSILWGNSAGTGLSGLTFANSGWQDPIIVYGRVPMAQNAVVGVYTDTITATINY